MTTTVADARAELGRIRTEGHMFDADQVRVDDLTARLLPMMTIDEPTEADDVESKPLSTAAAELLGGVVARAASLSMLGPWPQIRAVRSRIAPVLAAIESREHRLPGAMDAFSYHLGGLTYEPVHRFVTVEWLQGLEESGFWGPGPLIAATRICIWGDRWSEFAAPIIALLDHEDAYVRAVAAHRLGEAFNADRLEDPTLPDVAKVFALVGEAERARPGVASAFLWGLPYCYRPEPHETPPFDSRAWALDLLKTRSGEDPEIPQFNSLEWVGCEELWQASPYWARELLGFGRGDLAAWAATVGPHPVDGMLPVLVQLSHAADPVEARNAACILALHYRFCDDEATRRGFVRPIVTQHAFEGFAIFDHDDPVNARIVALYPKRPRRRFTELEANAAVDTAVPSVLRGAETGNDRESWNRDSWRSFKERVYVEYVRPSGRQIASIEIYGNGIQGPGWDPVSLLGGQ
jgi:hypothetical protein